MKNSNLFASMLISAVALAGCATTSDESEEIEDLVGEEGTDEAGESEEAVGEAESELGLGVTSPWAMYGTIAAHYSVVPVALTTFRSATYMAHLDPRVGALNWSTFNGRAWSSPYALTGFDTRFNPALASYRDSMHLTYLDSRTGQLGWSQFDGYQWGAPRSLGMTGRVGPAMATYNDCLYLTNLDPRTDEILYSTYDGRRWSPMVGTGIYSQTIPAMAVYAGRLNLLHTSAYSSRLRWSTFDGRAWSTRSNFLPNRLAYGAPSLGVYGSQLFFAHRSLAGNQLFWGAYDGRSWNDYGALPFATYGTPAFHPYGRDFYMVNPLGANTAMGHLRYGVY